MIWDFVSTFAMWVSFSNYSLRAVNVLGRHHPGNWLATLERKIGAENKKTLKNPGKTPSDVTLRKRHRRRSPGGSPGGRRRACRFRRGARAAHLRCCATRDSEVRCRP